MPRLGNKDDKYKKPDETFTEKLSKEDIKYFLEDYVKIDDINQIKKGSHVRYFDKTKDGLKFRMGGLVTVLGFPNYIILSNGSKTWSVQLKSAIIYMKLSFNELKKEFISEMEKLQSYNKHLYSENIKLKKQLDTKENK